MKRLLISFFFVVVIIFISGCVEKSKPDKAALSSAMTATPTPMATLSSVTTTPAPTATPLRTVNALYNIKIEGSDDFTQKTKAALSLIQEKDPVAYELIRKYVAIIASGKASGMMAYNDPPKYEVGERTYNSDTIWYAGTIAHDACHSKLYNDYKMQNPQINVPSDVWTGREAEAQCLNFQYNVLEKIGASASTLNYVKNIINTDYWEIPYDERNW
jgi:hypothetical protein